jgi:hypothetical protein
MKKVNETMEERLRRLELSKATQVQVMPDKTKYQRKDKHKKGYLDEK